MGSVGAAKVGGGVSRPFDGTVKLQGISKPQDARTSANLKPGDIIKYNYGYTGKVISVTPSASGKTVTLVTQSSETGNQYTRKSPANRLWAVADKENLKP